MADLERYPNESLPRNCYDQVMFLWLQNEDGAIEAVERDTEEGPCTHADQWGDDVWGNDNRGYYFPDAGIVTCHATFSDDIPLLNKVARKFKDAIYYHR